MVNAKAVMPSEQSIKRRCYHSKISVRNETAGQLGKSERPTTSSTCSRTIRPVTTTAITAMTMSSAISTNTVAPVAVRWRGNGRRQHSNIHHVNSTAPPPINDVNNETRPVSKIITAEEAALNCWLQAKKTPTGLSGINSKQKELTHCRKSSSSYPWTFPSSESRLCHPWVDSLTCC